MGYIEDLRAIVGTRPLILVGSVVVILNEQEQILLEERREPRGVWGLPGGLMELGESVEETAKREVFEETGLLIHQLTLIGVFSGSGYFVRAANGDEFYVVTIAFHTNHVSGSLRVDATESLGARFFDPLCLPEQMVGSHKRIIGAYLSTPRTQEPEN